MQPVLHCSLAAARDNGIGSCGLGGRAMLKSIRQRCDARAVKGMRECLYVAQTAWYVVTATATCTVCRQLAVVCCRRRPLSRRRRRTSAASDRRSPTRPSAPRPLFGTPPRTARLPCPYCEYACRYYKTGGHVRTRNSFQTRSQQIEGFGRRAATETKQRRSARAQIERSG